VKNSGFTMIEVVLFLAITSVLSLVAVLGLGPRFRNVRFTESMRNLESTVQKELVSSRSVNNRPNIFCLLDNVTINPLNITKNLGGAAAGKAEECVLNGNLLVFNPDNSTYQFHAIVSRRVPRSSCLTSPTDINNLLNCYQATIVGSDIHIQKYTYANGVKKISTSDNAIAYFQDPGTGQQYLYGFNNTGPHTGNFAMRGPVAQPAGPCLELVGGGNARQAKLQFTQNVLKPEMVFGAC
jgi:type II secretory pathway pseudopilin PulG